MGLKTAFCTAVVAGLVVSPAMAAVITSETAPSSNVVISTFDEEPVSHFDVSSYPNDFDKSSRLGSTFTTDSAFDLGGITVQHRLGYQVGGYPEEEPDPVTEVTAHVTLYAATDWDDFGTYSEIATASGDMPFAMDDETFISVIFDSGVSLDASTKYAFLFRYDTDGGRVLDRVTTSATGNDRYAGGGLLLMSMEGTEVDEFVGEGHDEGEGVHDMTFWIQDASVIPEPASLALLGLGGLAMLGRRRRLA
ncbi:MAG: PEP-CTERM sorting domain-containing protein [Phycisphaeraceae bacterium]